MKKIFYLASIAALAFSSCAKDETTEAQIDAVNGGAKITAAIAADDTRTSLEKVDGKYEFRWSAGDQLGVYGVGANTLNNAAFVLENASDGKAVGVFASQNVELKADQDYVAVYPRFQTSLFSNIDLKEVELDVPGTEGEEQDDYVDLTAVKVTIPAIQKYQNGTFYTGTVPAVSTEFFVNADGGANLSMQPVVDYLFVNIQSTEPIKTLTLSLNNGNDNLNIAGTAALSRYELGDSYRYVVQHNNMSSKFITLETDESYATVACHEPNTYVFAVPGGIFGTGYNVRAYLYVNKTTFGDNWDFAVADYSLNGRQMVDNTHLNWGDAKKTVKRLDKDGNAAVRLENTVFWANPISVDTDGDTKADARGTFTYNPYGDAIISNEVELLEYIHKYNAGTKVDAFLCEDGSFDFSIKNMMELATEYKNTKYEGYIADYLADVNKGGGFPCFDNYTNNFIGNGAVIENIEQPLLSWAGIFGGQPNLYSDVVLLSTRSGEFVETENGKASITNITFSNIVAKEATDKIGYSEIYGGTLAYYTRGHVLAGSFDGTIKNVTVKDANGHSIMGTMNVAQYNGMTIEGVSDLYYIANELTANASLDLTKTWDNVADVQRSVFEEITPDKNAKNQDALHVITVPEGGAEAYATLTEGVDVSTNSAVAVVIDGVSYWTGDSFDATAEIKSGDNKGGMYIKYAEELAAGLDGKAELASDMDLNFANLVTVDDYGVVVPEETIWWSGASFDSLDGAGHTVSDFNMYYVGAGSNVAIAPFYAPVVKNITLDGVNITNVTPDKSKVVAEYISGVTAGAETVSNVTVNDLAISAYRSDDTNNTEANYSNSYSVKVGWVSAMATDAQISNVTVNGVKSNVKGIAGLVAMNTIETSSKFVNAAAQNVDAINTPIQKFAKFDSEKKNYNVMGTAVGLVINNARRMADIKFMQCGEPVFLYDAPSTLNVIYNETTKGSLKN